MTLNPRHLKKPPKSPLQKQLEEQKFLHGVAYVEQASGTIKKLSSSELMHLNEILTNKLPDNQVIPQELWRLEAVKIEIPGGEVTLNMLSNPLSRAREITGDALEMAGNQKVLEAACYLYSQLVLEHLFKDANRRTAVLATIWLLGNFGIEVNAHQLLAVPIGNLRVPQEMAEFQAQVAKLLSSN